MSQEIRTNVQFPARYVGKRKDKLALMQDVQNKRTKEVENRKMKQELRKRNYPDEIRMQLEEAQEYELQLEKELRSLNPKSKALRFYPSTWKAIENYEKAIRRIETRRENRNKKQKEVEK